MSTILKPASEKQGLPWRGFVAGAWQSRVNVREFIQRNYTPFEGDGAFLQGATPRTRGLWDTLQPLLAKEREKGILDVSQIPSGIVAHGPGYIDKEREIIVGHSDKNRLLLVSFTERRGAIRIISARRATKREQHDYEQYVTS
jgi:formate C-acetyltransferase